MKWPHSVKSNRVILSAPIVYRLLIRDPNAQYRNFWPPTGIQTENPLTPRSHRPSKRLEITLCAVLRLSAINQGR